jgi:type IX secretion system PorP/SprF family membrane protein
MLRAGWQCRVGVLMALIALCALPVRAQQDPNWTMYMFNRNLISPGFAGYHGATNFTFAGRTQWVGLEGHPTSFSFAYSNPAPKLRGAIGAYLIGDKIGPFAGVELKGVYAYRFTLNQREDYVQIGLNAGILYRSLDGTNFRPPQSITDPVLSNAVRNDLVPDLGFGIALVGNDAGLAEKYYVGLGIQHLLEPALPSLTTSGDTRILRQINLTGGYRFDLARRISFQPSVLFRLAGAQWQVDLNANLTVSPMVFGLSYRLDDAVSALVGFQASSRLFLAYSYDYTTSRLGPATSGSHEIIISYTLPRFFRFTPPDYGPKYKRERR